MKNILCFGDSNTWGYNPRTKERFPWGVRWTSRLQEKLDENNVHIIEQGLCGRTTVFEDETRPNRKGVNTLKEIFDETSDIDSVILMLGTNDCKTYYGNTANEIAKGVEECLDLVLQHISPENVLLISPIVLGDEVWKDEFDPEFNRNSVVVSKKLKEQYEKLAIEKNVHFLAASEFAVPSVSDQEHMDEVGHSMLADAILESVRHDLRCA
ncbi:MAG: GDSL-type esterase/lipase family protein [Lachnospiraceae bacterium]|nr:GDSL-type esterase/lipase family protein [Lachnospiraceae bacterium]